MKKIFAFVVISIQLFLLTGCELESQELIELRNEVRFLETEISSLRGSPGFMYGEAFEYVDAGDYIQAVEILKNLQFEFPDWNAEVVNSFIEKYSEIKSKEPSID